MANMTENELVGLLARHIEQTGSQQAWAKAHGISKAYVCDVINRRAQPGTKILKALDLEKVIMYRAKKS